MSDHSQRGVVLISEADWDDLRLSPRTVEVLDEAADLSNDNGLVFPGTRPGWPLSESTHSKLLRELGFATVTHGFRSSYRDWAAEQTNAPLAVMEAALAYRQEQGGSRLCPNLRVREAAGLMDAWAAYLLVVCGRHEIGSGPPFENGHSGTNGGPGSDSLSG